jgi:ABC-type enterochelin transport system permease subunit
MGLNMKSLVLGKALIIAMVLGVTSTTLARLPFTGLFIVIVLDFSFASIQRSLEASQPLVPVSFSACRNVAVSFATCD